jgi:EAL domain-containing protein (putative c-di-GMP-specific phosphodiesterase class I)
MRWRAAGLPLAIIAVNLSPRQLLQDDIHLKVAAVLAESGLAPGHLELEITEGTLVRDAREVNDRLRKLKALGVRIAVDDFGTGYSSLVYLRRFPVDKIKIDRAFVGDVPDDSTDAEIVLAVIALGRILNLEVLAEGIERQSQLEFLNRHGCTTGQGFLFSAAVPAERIAGLYWPAKEVAA